MTDNIDKLAENPIQKTVLYRGYLPTGDDRPRTTSQHIDEIIANKLNPHSLEFADHLIWVTPDETYARGVVAMRFAVRFATDNEFRKKVEERQPDTLPCLATYSINNSVNIFNAKGKELHKIQTTQNLPEQIIIEKIDPTSVNVLNMTVDSADKLIDIFENRPNMDETAYRAVTYLRHETNKDPFEGRDWSKSRLAEMIKVAYDFYISTGMNNEDVEEKLAKGLFGYSSYMHSVADSLAFK